MAMRRCSIGSGSWRRPVFGSLLPPHLSARLEKIEPAGLFIVIGLSVFGLFAWLFDPAYHVVRRVIHELLGASA